MNNSHRFTALDAFRGLAVILMVIFHFTYDMWLFNLTSIEVRTGFWYALPRFIVFVFLWCVGASLQISHGQGIKWKKFGIRLGKLVALAVIISAVTYFTFPKSWIYFGTLHCIAGVTILAIPFLYYPKARLPVLALILLAQYGLGYDIAWVGTLFPRYSMDFIPVYPWFWVTLLGMISGNFILTRCPQKIPLQKFFVWPGVHALKIYLIHQPLLYGICALWRMLLERI